MSIQKITPESYIIRHRKALGDIVNLMSFYEEGSLRWVILNTMMEEFAAKIEQLEKEHLTLKERGLL